MKNLPQHQTTQELKILLVEDDWAVRGAVRDFLSKRAMNVAEAGCLEDALVTAETFMPDVAVIDIVVPCTAEERADFDKNVGIDIAQKLRQRLPSLGIVFLSAYVDRGPEIIQLFLEGHDRINYLLKGSKPAELLEAIQKVARGASALEIATGVQTTRKTAFDLALKSLGSDERAYLLVALEALPSLSEPERLVFECIGRCHSRQQAAQALNLSVKTISNHMDAIYTKLHLREGDPSLNQLALLAKIHLLAHLRQCVYEETSAVHEGLT